MRTLDEIGTANGTDKASFGHSYMPFYEFLFAKFRDEPVNILEIGVQFGFSLRTWREYFKRSLICGIDSAHNGLSFPPEEGIAFIVGEAYKPEMITRLGNAQFDIIVEDGNHAPADQAWTIKHYAPLLSPGGILVVEDVPSMETALDLKKAVPTGFQGVSVDLRKEGGMPDSILFLVWRA